MILGEDTYLLIEEDTPVTLFDIAAARLWETFRVGGGAGLIREAVELVLWELIEGEAAEAIGAGRYERSDARSAERNGHRPRLLATWAGDLELKIPKLRKGSFFPSLLEPRRRIHRALWAVVMEAKDRSPHGRRQSRRGGLRCVSPSALAEDLVHQPPSSASTKRSNAEHASWASSPTKPQPSASSEPSWPTSTTNGRPPTAATYQKTP